MSITILGIESSCDDTSAAIVTNGYVQSNEIANQRVHEQYGGVIPEFASRAHQKNIIPVVECALENAGVKKSEIDAVAFTRGPGLLGSLIVGTSFAKGFSLAHNVPIMGINHLKAHILANFVKEPNKNITHPSFPFLCLLVSGGHTQLVKVSDYLSMEVIGKTIDDAAGEAFDKCAKVMGLPYPGGPMIDKYATYGNKNAFSFTKPQIADLNYSFSGLKTAFLYLIRDKVKTDPDFIEKHKYDLCASIQSAIIDILMNKLVEAAKETGIKEVALAGGVSANSQLKATMHTYKQEYGWNIYIPEIKYTTDNAAMIALTGYFRFIQKQYDTLDIEPLARYPL